MKTKWIKYTSLYASLAFALLLTACGGGGDNNGPSPPPPVTQTGTINFAIVSPTPTCSSSLALTIDAVDANGDYSNSQGYGPNSPGFWPTSITFTDVPLNDAITFTATTATCNGQPMTMTLNPANPVTITSTGTTNVNATFTLPTLQWSGGLKTSGQQTLKNETWNNYQYK